MEILDIVINSVKNISIFSVMDILVVSYIFYKGYMLMKETRAEQLLKGIVLILFLIPVSDLLNLTMLNWILSKTITIGVLSLIIIFQPEIRSALEHLGRTAFTDRQIFANEETVQKVVNEIVTAIGNLSVSRTGALVIIEQFTGLEDIIKTGTRIDAIVSSALLENIFVVNTPLHDGATIIRNDRVVSSGCFLPLTENRELNKKLGTRHRAAIGISEKSDAIIIVVSEETGTISLVLNGNMTRNYTEEKLRSTLTKIIKKRQHKKLTFRERVIQWIKNKKDTR
ncbi:TIGR00159 family protein [Clostridium fermenticellae]|uniref:Diadenylate cyclase n=1 Tax=Clostridium fermenticellae TaxID=2068654 RepID=A0A386H0U3_9CLOT|nr:diadenylate cyclase CdaA [Clostridium fermenticellae]AYD39301.1 TIGR00159 family protein [Clostridium fermenticellae]